MHETILLCTSQTIEAENTNRLMRRPVGSTMRLHAQRRTAKDGFRGPRRPNPCAEPKPRRAAKPYDVETPSKLSRPVRWPELRPRTVLFRQSHQITPPPTIAQTAQRARRNEPVRGRPISERWPTFAACPAGRAGDRRARIPHRFQRQRSVGRITRHARACKPSRSVSQRFARFNRLSCRLREQALFSTSAAMLGRSDQIYATNTFADRRSINILALSANGGQVFCRNSNENAFPPS